LPCCASAHLRNAPCGLCKLDADFPRPGLSLDKPKPDMVMSLKDLGSSKLYLPDAGAKVAGSRNSSLVLRFALVTLALVGCSMPAASSQHTWIRGGLKAGWRCESSTKRPRWCVNGSDNLPHCWQQPQSARRLRTSRQQQVSLALHDAALKCVPSQPLSS
jgi:hypothetical protein